MRDHSAIAIQPGSNGNIAMAFWSVVQVQPQRGHVALHWLGLHKFEVYAPRIRELCIVRGRKTIRTPLLFEGYIFLKIHLQWSQVFRPA